MDEDLTGLDKYISLMSEDPRFADVDWKVSYSTVEPFPDFVVKKQKTIISTGNYIIPPPNPETFPGGKHLKPEEFHGSKGTDDPQGRLCDPRRAQQPGAYDRKLQREHKPED